MAYFSLFLQKYLKICHCTDVIIQNNVNVQIKLKGLVLQAIELLLCQASVGNDLIVGYSVEKHGFCHFFDTLQDTLPDTFLDTFLHTFFVSVIEQGSLHSDSKKKKKKSSRAHARITYYIKYIVCI